MTIANDVRVSPHNPVRHGLRTGTQLSIPSRAQDKPEQCAPNPRGDPGGSASLRIVPQLVRRPICYALDSMTDKTSRRDGSPFMNLLQCAPLCDSQGRVKYFIGAQIDVSGLALDGAQMESLIELQSRYRDPDEESIAEMPQPKAKDEFQELSELLSPRELTAVQQHGGDLFQPLTTRASARSHQRTWLQRGASMDSEAEAIRLRDLKSPILRGSLTGVYENVSRSAHAFAYSY